MEVHQSEFINTLIQGYKCSGSSNGFKFEGFQKLDLGQRSEHGDPSSSDHHPPNPSNSVQSWSTNSETDTPPEENDFSGAILKYINQMLMEEEDLEHKPCMFQDCLALQAAEKSFYDVLVDNYPPSVDAQTADAVVDSSHDGYDVDCLLQSFESPSSSSVSSDGPGDSLPSPFPVPESTQLAGKTGRDNSPNGSRGKKNHYREDSDYAEGGRSNKQFAGYSEESEEQSEMYDKVLLCAVSPYVQQRLALGADDEALQNEAASKPHQNERSSGRRPRGKKRGNVKEVVDLRTLLTQCAQAVASNDGRAAAELLKRIRQHSSPVGDGTERLAHFVANALETRLEGAGTAIQSFYPASGISAADILKGYQVFIAACPFKILSNIFANKSISRASKKATSLHIIDFGILYGFQWPCFIQGLSVRPGGPPKLRITGIEFPQPGFRPSERVEETGRRLAKYCKRFNVPFEYHAMAKKWDAIEVDDLKIDRDELLVVNCLHRLDYVADDTVALSSPRDAVLKLIKRMNPDLFVHGVLNGTYNAPFFVSRFREALFHFSALFDMFDATVPREDKDRALFEKEVFGRDAMNVIACEGAERVVRPETYKQWQGRNVRAGFRQLTPDPEIVGFVRAKVRKDYHKDFVVDEDGKWLLQGWKGRIIYALSCWRPSPA